MVCGTYFPDQGLSPGPLHWEHGNLATGPPGKSPKPLIKKIIIIKNPLMKVKKESERAGLKLNIQKTKIMASGPITSWQIDGNAMQRVRDFIFLGSKSLQVVTAARKLKDAYSLEEKL